MTPRKRAILIVASVAIFLIALIIVIILLMRRVSGPASTPSATGTPAIQDQAAVKAPGLDPLNPPAAAASPGRTAAAQMAELFAERYGSYSNQGDYQNLRDLLPIMTDSYRKSAETYLASAPSSAGQAFEGVTSVKISTDIRAFDAGAAVVAVTLQQEKTSGSAVSTVAYRTLRLELVKVSDDWRIAAAAWEN